MSYRKKIAVNAALIGGTLLSFPAFGQVFSLVCVPDPQHYSGTGNESKFNLYRKQANWIINNTSTYNIKHSVWLGDLTNDNTPTQWSVANKAFTLLDNANSPYSIIPGNHDYCTDNPRKWLGVMLRDMTRYNGIFPQSRFIAKNWFGGTRDGRMENNYTYYSSNGLDFMLVNLEYAPRKEVLTWANNLIKQHPNHRVIIATHSYIGGNGSYTGSAAPSAGGLVGATGREVFQGLASRHSNVFLVVCGHITESKVNNKTGANGNRVYEMVVDYQKEGPLNAGSGLGNGWLRLLQFNPALNRIEASTIAVDPANSLIFNQTTGPQFFEDVYNSNPNHSDHKFNLSYNMTNPMGPYFYMNAELEFNCAGVATDLTSDQRKPSIATDDYGNLYTAWAEDNDNNGIFNIRARLLDSDGNLKANKFTVKPAGQNSVQATNPVIAATNDGRFVIVWESGSSREILARTYHANGIPTHLNTVSIASVPEGGKVQDPALAIDSEGNYTVAWADDGDGNGTYQIIARSLSFSGTERFLTKPVNPLAAGQQTKPAIAMRPNGNHIIAWQDNRQGTWDIAFRGFNSDGTELIPHDIANSSLAGNQISPTVAMRFNGQFVIVWADDADADGESDIVFRGFTPVGAERFPQKIVNAGTSGDQRNPSLSLDSDGYIHTVWEDGGKSGVGYQIVMNSAGPFGNRVSGSETTVSPANEITATYSPSVRSDPKISTHKSGRPVVIYTDDMDGNKKFQVLAKGLSGTAVTLGAAASAGGAIVKSPDAAFYSPNTVVNITAVPEPGFVFSGWSGDLPSGANPSSPNQTLTLSETKKIRAVFVPSSLVEDSLTRY